MEPHEGKRRLLRGSSEARGGIAIEDVVGKIIREPFHKCGFCSGTGQRPLGSTCPACKGRGEIAINPPAVRCAFCRGRGEAQPRSMITCLACKDKGIVSIVEPIEVCSQCNGSGRSSASHALACGRCKGKGVVSIGRRMGGDVGEESRFLRSPGGSERDVAEAIYQLGGEAAVAEIAPRIRVSSSYTEYVCKSMASTGYLERLGRTMYALTPECERAMERKEVSDLERVTPEQKAILNILSHSGDTTPKEIADKMSIKDVRYVTKLCNSMGKENLVDVLLSGKVVLTPKGERALPEERGWKHDI